MSIVLFYGSYYYSSNTGDIAHLINSNCMLISTSDPVNSENVSSLLDTVLREHKKRSARPIITTTAWQNAFMGEEREKY